MSVPTDDLLQTILAICAPPSPLEKELLASMEKLAIAEMNFDKAADTLRQMALEADKLAVAMKERDRRMHSDLCFDRKAESHSYPAKPSLHDS